MKIRYGRYIVVSDEWYMGAVKDATGWRTQGNDEKGKRLKVKG